MRGAIRLVLAGALLSSGLLFGQLGLCDEAATPPKPELDETGKLDLIFQASDGARVKGKRWVVIDTGPVDWKGERLGWLLEEREDKLTLLDDVGWVLILQKPSKGQQKPKTAKNVLLEQFLTPKDRIAWEVRDGDFATFCKKHLTKGLPDLFYERKGFRMMDGGRGGLAGWIIITTRYGCWARQTGQTELAEKLFAQAKKGQELYGKRFGWGDERSSLHLFVADQLVAGCRSGAISAAHAGAARTELLKQWETLAVIPYHQEREQAGAIVRHYKDLIAEDRAWEEPTREKLARMSEDERVRYWMYHLRDHAVGQFMDPGMCFVLSSGWLIDPEPTKDQKPNPAVELKKLGLAAVPQIIAHLDDERPTRCQGHWRMYAPDSFYLLRYGDCCQQILESISGLKIYERKDTNGYPIKDGQGKACKEKAERWWMEYQKKGEKQILIERTEIGDTDSPEQARRLVAQYPASAFEPISRGASQARGEFVRLALVQSAAELKGEKVPDFLRTELKGPYRGSRVAAAQALVARGVEEGAQALAGEWAGVKWDEKRSFEQRWSLEQLIVALCHTGNPETIRSLCKDFGEKPIEVRTRIIASVSRLKKDAQGRPLSQAAKRAIEEVLVLALADKEETNSVRGDPDGKTLADPAVGDLAAEVLIERWKQPQLFDIYGPLSVRERQRVEVKNVWLKKQGKEQEPVPAPAKIEPLPQEKLRPLLQALRDARTPEARRKALESLEACGLPALPGVRTLLKETASNVPARADLEALARRMALVVRVARFADESTKPEEKLRKTVESLQGKPITRAALLNVLRSATGSLPKGSRGVDVTVERLGDDTGVNLIVTLIADRPARKDVSPQLSIREKIVCGNKSLHNGTRGMAGIGQEVTLAGIDWSEFSECLNTALEAGPDQYLLVQVRCAEMR
jgi:hypothetical protein